MIFLGFLVLFSSAAVLMQMDSDYEDQDFLVGFEEADVAEADDDNDPSWLPPGSVIVKYYSADTHVFLFSLPSDGSRRPKDSQILPSADPSVRRLAIKKFHTCPLECGFRHATLGGIRTHFSRSHGSEVGIPVLVRPFTMHTLITCDACALSYLEIASFFNFQAGGRSFRRQIAHAVKSALTEAVGARVKVNLPCAPDEFGNHVVANVRLRSSLSSTLFFQACIKCVCLCSVTVPTGHLPCHRFWQHRVQEIV